MLRHHRSQMRQYPLLSGVSLNANGNGAVVSPPIEASTLLVTLAALSYLCVQYMYHLTVYLKCLLVGNMISLLFFQQYCNGRGRDGGRSCFGILWSREEVQISFRQKSGGRGRGDTILFLSLLIGSNEALVACERFISREFYGTWDI